MRERFNPRVVERNYEGQNEMVRLCVTPHKNTPNLKVQLN